MCVCKSKSPSCFCCTYLCGFFCSYIAKTTDSIATCTVRIIHRPCPHLCPFLSIKLYCVTPFSYISFCHCVHHTSYTIAVPLTAAREGSPHNVLHYYSSFLLLHCFLCLSIVCQSFSSCYLPMRNQNIDCINSKFYLFSIAIKRTHNYTCWYAVHIE